MHNLLSLLALLRSVSLFHTALASKTPIFCSWLFQHFVLLPVQAPSYFTSVYPYSFNLSVRGSIFIAVSLPTLQRHWFPFLSIHIHPTQSQTSCPRCPITKLPSGFYLTNLGQATHIHLRSWTLLGGVPLTQPAQT